MRLFTAAPIAAFKTNCHYRCIRKPDSGAYDCVDVTRDFIGGWRIEEKGIKEEKYSA